MRRIGVSVAISLALLVGEGCRSSRREPAAQAPGAAEEHRPEPEPVAVAPAAKRPAVGVLHAARPPNWEGPWRPGQTREAPNLRATYGSDARIRLTGRDRWGRPLDVTFESPRFFADAIPALSRSLTDAQAMRLRQLAYLVAEQ